MKSQRKGEQGRGGELPDWSIEIIQIGIAVLVTITAYFVLAQFGSG